MTNHKPSNEVASFQCCVSSRPVTAQRCLSFHRLAMSSLTANRTLSVVVQSNRIFHVRSSCGGQISPRLLSYILGGYPATNALDIVNADLISSSELGFIVCFEFNSQMSPSYARESSLFFHSSWLYIAFAQDSVINATATLLILWLLTVTTRI
ncbi:hypothetical protein DFH05DRAFT_1501623 [Lentinula detonsa]|uniref:Uncharacterized protein n=1 Tax=Lentinula detonsa TaxID=2804962 RepID=A0A9W8NXD7_9AGAR|nr:hypothetical protein DFH05DRAFT_1501623 [Lentinula detonsa]